MSNISTLTAPFHDPCYDAFVGESRFLQHVFGMTGLIKQILPLHFNLVLRYYVLYT